MDDYNKNKDLRKEVESHSSALTNIRIAEIKSVLWKKSIDVMSSPKDPRNSLNLFSAVTVFFMETPGLYDPDDTPKIENEIRKGNRIAQKLRITGKITKREQEDLLQASLRANYMINLALQKMRYFFRLGKHQPRGIEAALEVFKTNGDKSDIGEV